ncbi:ATP-dependent Clp protease proteolytic subunit-related protein [Vigna angularis]|uniref:ATP-dependent Clp protease proteolytic subunit n=1 Tax=Phaseolus angularis TaxID=3914 RepID=A0A8T0KQF0_PHAAN|nr:ATP-dependent Clp protease proteolytic subunit-related protein [Vigna angularis]
MRRNGSGEDWRGWEFGKREKKSRYEIDDILYLFICIGLEIYLHDEDWKHVLFKFATVYLQTGLKNSYKISNAFLFFLSRKFISHYMNDNKLGRIKIMKKTEYSFSAKCSLDHVPKQGMNHSFDWFSHSCLSGMGKNDASRYSMSARMYQGGWGSERPPTAPPDLPSLLLDARICYLGMPIVPAVTELIVAQFMWLDFDNPTKPIYFYINSSGTQNEKHETVGSETDAYSIADMISYVKADVYTVNCGMAFGQAAMLLSLGTKGYRAVQPNSSTKLYLPKVNRSSGAVIDMWIKAKELEANSDYYIDLLVKGTGKSKEEITKDVQRPKYLQAQQAIDYGLADKMIQSSSTDSAFEKRESRWCRSSSVSFGIQLTTGVK